VLILHASEDNGFLHLWGEVPPEGGVSGGDTTAAWRSPYDPGAAPLVAAVRPFAPETEVGSAWTVNAYLPGDRQGPIPSHPLIAERIVTKLSLLPWQVTVIPLDADEMLSLLEACRSKGGLPPGVRAGASLAYWATAVLPYALSLVLRQQVLPDVAEEAPGEWTARWSPVYAGEDAGRLVALARAMPAACRALTEAESAPELSAKAVLERVLTRLCDRLMRPPSSARVSRSAGKATKFDSLHEQWLAALRSRDGAMQGEAAELAAFARTVREWRRPLFTSIAAPFRLCLRLEEPPAEEADADPEGVPWFVHYLLQSAADPSLLVPAKAAWNDRSEEAPLLRAPGFAPREFLLTALGRAAQLCPEIGPSLKKTRPDGFPLTHSEVLPFLTERAALLEQAGFVVQLPGWWSGGRNTARAGLTTRVVAKSPKMQWASDGLTMESMIAFDLEVALGDQTLTFEELERLAAQKTALVRLRGQWAQVDAEQIQRAIVYWKRQQARPEMPVLTLRELVRMSLGAEAGPAGLPIGDVTGDGPVGQLLKRLTDKASIAARPTPPDFKGTLRPYQERGYAWLRFLTDLGMGACLADDMGLGKSAQTIALLLDERSGAVTKAAEPVLIICPTSVVGNWQRELARFAPSLSVLPHYGADRLRGDDLQDEARSHDVLLTSYALLVRDLPVLQTIGFRGVVLDEAQNIKNPETKQSKAARALKTDWRVALTGTPVENHVGDLWSLFEFLNPGLLGTESAFRREFYLPIQMERDPEAASRLQRRTGPLLLRRLKTDRSIIADLPDKVEMDEFCPLTREQITLYEAILRDMETRLEESEGMARRGLVLATLMKLKQVCNHPAQLLADNSPLPGRSGKLNRLWELAGEIVEAGDKALIFTQFAEMGTMLQRYLRERVDGETLFLHGGVPKKERDRMVERFQSMEDIPFFILSLKAGGVGLNLTAASHVIHFDRWWNPAVEDQATDRAFRIGQKRNVMVRKFVCRGTLEEKISERLARKRDVASNVVGSGELWITELSTTEIRDLFALTPDAAVEEG